MVSVTGKAQRSAMPGFAVAMLGARMNYAVPRILNAAGMLERFYTDYHAGSGWGRALRLWPRGLRPAGVRRLLGRSPEGVPADRITAFNGFGLSYAARLKRGPGTRGLEEIYLWAGRRFCELILERGLESAAGVYAFNTAGFELLDAAHRDGRRTILEQTSTPREIDQQIMAEERLAFPHWETAPHPNAPTDALAGRERAEWSASDVIICGSGWVVEGIRACGGPASRCRVVPYGVEVAGGPPAPFGAVRKGQQLRVLTVGHVGLRKGAQYVLQAARMMGERVQFRMVGEVAVSAGALAELRGSVDVLGHVPRTEIDVHYRWAHVLLLPSLSEGSALVTYEALARGLPVICTSNTGSPVRDGIDGFIVPVRDSEAIAERLERFVRWPELRQEMSANASDGSRALSLSRYAERLLGILTNKAGKIS